MKIEKIKFKFKGQRDYIHGTDMFNFMMTLEVEKKSQIKFTIHEFVRNPLCHLYHTDNKDELSGIPNIVTRLQYSINDKKQFLALVQDQEQSQQELPERYEYDESLITEICQIRGSKISICQETPFTFIETIVAMNKYLHEMLFPDVAGKWVFTRIDLDSTCDVKTDIEVHFQHNMNFRLTKSDVIVNNLKVGDIFFSLVKT